MRQTELGGATLLGLGARRLGEHRLRGRRSDAGGERQLDELAARDLPAADQLLSQLQFLHALRHRNFPPSS
jgi:hypothetical protein